MDGPDATADDQRREAEEEDGAAERDARDARGRFTAGNAYRWTQGVSGNPSGRPVGIGPLIDQILAEEIDTALGKREALELMVRAVVRTALKGGSSGTAAFRELMDRRFGRVPLSVRLGPEEDEGPREIRIRVVNREDVLRDAASMRRPLLPGENGNGAGGNGNG